MDENGTITKKDLAGLEARFDARLDRLETGLEARIDVKLRALKTEIVDELTELTRDVETRLLTSFHGYGKGQAARMHTLEVADSDIGIRLAALEERILNLETRRGHGSH
jgi:hypothetical protein